MPPKRKSPAAGSPRKTRSMVAAGKRVADAAPAKAVPAKKKEEEAAVAEQKGRKRAKKDEAVTAAAEPKGRKRGKKEAEENGGDAAAGGKRVIVEACTQCRQFKIRAQKVKEDLESSVPGVSVIINPQKPRRGCLEIHEEGGEVFISLLNMPRPFTPMKKLDMDEVIKDIAKKISWIKLAGHGSMAPFFAPKLQAEQVILQVYGVPSCRVTINRTSYCIVDVSTEFGTSGHLIEFMEGVVVRFKPGKMHMYPASEDKSNQLLFQAMNLGRAL